jgi:hypothetical protein
MATDTPFEDDLDPLTSTADVIEAARRPMVIKRHRPEVEQIVARVDDAAMDSWEAPSDQAAAFVEDFVHTIANDERLHNQSLASGMIERLCLEREAGQDSDNGLLQLAIGAYAKVQESLQKRHSTKIPLVEVRSLAARNLNRLLRDNSELSFGHPGLNEGIVVTELQAQRVMATVKRIGRGKGGDSTWAEADGDPPLPREQEEPLESLPPEERREARTKMVRDRIRHRFFKKVFLVYFDVDTLDPEEVAAHRSVLHWLESIEETPHLYPFMQGQTQEQKIFRVQQLWRKIVQLNELYQRIWTASQSSTYAESFEGLDSRRRLSVLAKDRYPACRVDEAFTIATACCPFDRFAEWVQGLVNARDFVLPPEPKR